MSHRAPLVEWALFATLCVAAAGYLAGCEDNAEEDSFHDPNVSPLVVKPSSVTLREGTYVVFSVEGGSMPYNWSVSDASLGTVPDTQASLVTYNRKEATLGANQVIVIDKNGWSSYGVVNQLAIIPVTTNSTPTNSTPTNSIPTASTNAP